MALLRRARKDTSMAALVAAHQRHLALEGDDTNNDDDDSDSEEEQKWQRPTRTLPPRRSHPPHAFHSSAHALTAFDERDEENYRDDDSGDDNSESEEEEEWPASDRSRPSPQSGRALTDQYVRHDTDDDSELKFDARAAKTGRYPHNTTYATYPPRRQRRSVRFSESDAVTDETSTPESDGPRANRSNSSAGRQQRGLYHYGPQSPDRDAKRDRRASRESDTRRRSTKVSSALRKPMQLMRDRSHAQRRARLARHNGVDDWSLTPPNGAAACASDKPSDDAKSARPVVVTDSMGLVKVDAKMIAYIDETLVKPNHLVFNHYTRFFLDKALEQLYQEYTAINWFSRARWHIALLMLVHVLVLLLFCVLPASGFENTDQFVLSSDSASTYAQWTYLVAALPFALVPSRWNPCQKRWRVWACFIVVLFNFTFQLWLAHAGQLALEQFSAIVDSRLACSTLNTAKVNETRTVRANSSLLTTVGSASSASWVDAGGSWSGPVVKVNVSRTLTPTELRAKTYEQQQYVKVSTHLYAGALTQILTGFAWLFSFIFVISIRLEFVYVMVVGFSAVITYMFVIFLFAIQIEWMTTVTYAFATVLLFVLSRSADLTNRRSFLSTFVVERENESLKSAVTKAEAALMNEPAGEKEKEVVEQVLDVPEMRALEVFRIPFADLKFLEAIGRGAMGDVIKAKYLGTVVVCKRIRREHITAATLESFREEVVLMSCLRHPNIVQFIGASWDNYSNLCIVMEYLENGDMHSVLNSSIGKSFTWADPLLKMAIDIVQGMLYLHSQEPPIVHRDLKSVNVLCSKTYGCNVGDFGLSRRYNRGDVNPLKTLVGTPFWLAPEIIRNDRYGPAADVYSFGIVLTELEARKTPYHELGEAENRGVKVLMRVAYDNLRPTLPPTCLPSRRALITDCLLADPAQRPTFAQILARLQGPVQREIEEDATRATAIEPRTLLKNSHVTAL